MPIKKFKYYSKVVKNMSFAKNLVSYLKKLEKEGKLHVADVITYYRPTSISPDRIEELNDELSVAVKKEEELSDSVVFDAEKVGIWLDELKGLHPTLEGSLILMNINKNGKVKLDVDLLSTMEITRREKEAETIIKNYLEKRREVRKVLSNMIRNAGYENFEIHLPSKKEAELYLRLIKKSGEGRIIL